MCKKDKCGMWRPSTTTQTVSGVERISPAGPHSVAQNTVVSSSASDEIPVCAPYSSGSSKFAMTNSKMVKSRKTNNGGIQLSKTASESTSGSKPALTDPT